MAPKAATTGDLEVLDLEEHQSEDTHTFQLMSADDVPLFAGKDPETGEPTKPVQVTVYGPGSKQYQRSLSRIQSKAVDRVKRHGRNARQTTEERLQEQAEHLADVTAGFQNLAYRGLSGRELALAIYQNPKLGYIATQVSKNSDDWANFTKGSSTT